MTPKEKAIEMFNKMYQVDNILFIKAMDKYQAKQCALIVVEEILSNDFLEPQPKRHIGNVPPSKIHLEYWFQVKEELKKL
jgi:hypothetical protein